MSAIEAGWLYSGPRTCENSQGWFVPVMDKDGMLRFSRCLFELRIEERMRELGIEVNDYE